MLNQSQKNSKLALTRAKLRSMHSELSYGLSFAPKLQRVASMRLSGSHQPTPDPSFSRIQNVLATAHQTAGAALGRATDRSPIKMHHLERYTGLEWHDHAKTAAALYTRA